jgi:hypothetical protein
MTHRLWWLPGGLMLLAALMCFVAAGANLADGLSIWLALGIAFLVLGGMDLSRRRIVKQVP